MRVGDLFALEIDLATQQEDGNLPLLKRLVELARFSDDESDESKAELARLEMTTEKLMDAGDLAKLEAEKAKEEEERKDNLSGGLDQVGGLGGMGMDEAVKGIAEAMKHSSGRRCKKKT